MFINEKLNYDEKINKINEFNDASSEEKYQMIIDSLLDRVRKNKKVIFIGDFETNTFEKDGYIILEITDITDPLQIFVEDKSRGSDYGD